MAKDTTEDTVSKLYDFVTAQIKGGADKPQIVEKMVEMGVDKGEATSLVHTIYDDILRTASEQKFTSDVLLSTVIGGVLAAILGGIMWGYIVILTEYEIGYVACALGGLSGVGVVLCAQGKRGLPLQGIAVLSSMLGIAIGKYIFFYDILRKFLTAEHGTEVAGNISIFSLDVVKLFIENIGITLGGFDILWVILAIITAWRIPKGTGIKVRR